MDKDVLMTREKLKNYSKLVRDIKILRQELNKMNTTEAGLGHSIIFDYRDGFPKPQAIVGFDQDRYNRKRRLLDKKEMEAADIYLWIENIEDVVTRQVFKLYYINKLSWVEVAKRIGYRNNPDYPRIMIRDKYFKKKNIK